MQTAEPLEEGTVELITTTDLARRWHTTEQAIYSARHRGQGPQALRVGRRLLFRLADVLVWESLRLEAPGHGASAISGPAAADAQVTHRPYPRRRPGAA